MGQGLGILGVLVVVLAWRWSTGSGARQWMNASLTALCIEMRVACKVKLDVPATCISQNGTFCYATGVRLYAFSLLNRR